MRFVYRILIASSGLILATIAVFTIQKYNATKKLEANIQLLKAAEKGNLPQIKDALAKGADINAVNENKWTALMYAIQWDNLNLAQFLLSQGANPNLKDMYEATPLMITCMSARSEPMIKLLVESGADVNAKNMYNWTPLHFCADGGTGESFVRNIKLLLDKGADINALTDTGETPLLKAVHFPSNLEIVTLLLKRGADVNRQSYPDSFGYAPLHDAAIYSSHDMVKLLLDNGANVNAQATGKLDKGDTVLHRAAYVGDESLAKLLLSKGADPLIKNALGETPYDIAKKGPSVTIEGESEDQVNARKKSFETVIALLEPK